MDNLLAQLILAARDKDFESWTNILFIVVIGIFWVVGGILKAKANKSKQQEQEQPGRKLPESTQGPPKAFKQTPYRQAQRPVGPTPKSQPRPQVQPPRRKIVRPQAVGRKPSIKSEEAIELPTLEALETPKVSLPGPQLQADTEVLPEFTAKTIKKLEDMRISTPAETPQAKYLAEILLDYDDPEKLRRAILHYEILGKPLSLRRSSEHII